MKVRTPGAPQGIAYIEQLKKIISPLPIPMAKKIEVLNKINEICYMQTTECVHGEAMAQLLALHERAGYGRRRMAQHVATTQKIMDSYASKYDIGACDAMQRDLALLGYHFELQNYGGKKNG